jgi:magnesium-transporting ATPase (P-type)
MNTKLIQSLIAGLVGTAVMTFIMTVAPEMGIPESNQPAMLATILGISITMGWLIHFLIGIVFAGFYVYLFSPIVPIESKMMKGAIYGFFVSVFAQITLVIMTSIISVMAAPVESTKLLIIRSVMGHVVFGMYVGLFVKDTKPILSAENAETHESLEKI